MAPGDAFPSVVWPPVLAWAVLESTFQSLQLSFQTTSFHHGHGDCGISHPGSEGKQSSQILSPAIPQASLSKLL